jgi:hypothetical protein
MKIKINKCQLKLLADNFIIVEGQGLKQNEKYLIQESRMPEYLVTILIHGQPAALRISGYSQTSVLNIARTLFPKATITGSATLIR